MRTALKLAIMNSVSGRKNDPGAAYAAVGLAMNPLAYYPLDDASGSIARDASGNNLPLEYDTLGVTYGQQGLKGKCIQITMDGAGYKLKCPDAFRAAFDPREFTIAMLLKCDITPTSEIKVFEGWNAANDYSAFEIRNNGGNALYLKEGGVNQTDILTDILGTFPDEQWALYIMFNSESTGNVGIWYNGEYRPGVRKLAGITPPIVYNTSGFLAGLNGYCQHVIVWNRQLTQGEVDDLYEAAFGIPEAWTPNYLLRDEFTTDDDAPITSPRTSEPGPGTLDATDTGNKFSISTGAMRWSTRTGANDPRLVTNNAIPILAGRALAAKFTPGAISVGWGVTKTATPQTCSLWFQAGSVYANDGAPTLTALAAGQEYTVVNIQHTLGFSHWYVKGGTLTDWTLFWFGPSALSYYAGFGTMNASAITAVNSLRVADLPTPFQKQYGVASTALQGKRSANDSFTHPANCWITFQVISLPSAGQIIDLRFRIQDASNYWQVTIDSTGASVLNEVVNNVATQRGTRAGTAAAGSIIILYTVGATIGAYYKPSNWVGAWSYASATNFQTETDGLLAGVGTGGVVSDIIVYSRTLQSEYRTYLDQIAA